ARDRRRTRGSWRATRRRRPWRDGARGTRRRRTGRRTSPGDRRPTAARAGAGRRASQERRLDGADPLELGADPVAARDGELPRERAGHDVVAGFEPATVGGQLAGEPRDRAQRVSEHRVVAERTAALDPALAEQAAEDRLVHLELLLDGLRGEAHLPADVRDAAGAAPRDEPELDAIGVVEVEPTLPSRRKVDAARALRPELVDHLGQPAAIQPHAAPSGGSSTTRAESS